MIQGSGCFLERLGEAILKHYASKYLLMPKLSPNRSLSACYCITTIVTRRFFARLLGVSFSTTGLDSP
jgi:hypothetical protein